MHVNVNGDGCSYGVVSPSYLRWWCFSFHPLARIPFLHFCAFLAVVVDVCCCGSGGCSYEYMIATCTAEWWYFKVCTKIRLLSGCQLATVILLPAV